MKLAIMGSRNCSPIDISSYIWEKPELIVSGGAKGVDTYAREYAEKNHIPIKEFLPEYARFGRQAPLLRNIKIVENSDYILAFWDGVSRGTKFTIDYALKHNVPVRVIVIR